MKTRVLLGLDRLELADASLRGCRIGLMTHPAAIGKGFRSAVEMLSERHNLTALFACEHGIRGSAQAGEAVGFAIDPDTGIPVFSLYGETRRMTPAMLDAFDTLVFDMQDVGARFYTYLYALSYAMESCAGAGRPVVVLDRPNPLGGLVVSGTILDERFHSFVGEYALPTRYALTVGEYALWVKHRLSLNLELTVVPLSGWERASLFCDTGLPWVAPSPNCPTPETAFVYSGTCIFEGTNLSEGRGTTLPFHLIGAPYIDGGKLERRMAGLGLPGLHFRRADFVPCFSKWTGEVCHGVQMHVTDFREADPFAGGLMLMDAVRDLYPEDFAFRASEDARVYAIDRLLGTDAYRLGALDAPGLIEAHRPLLRAFEAGKKQFELYGR